MTPLALYIHWPFCAALCPYCDFNVHIKRDISTKDFADGITAELAMLSDILGERNITSIFFGGGTPSLMPPDLVEAIIAAIKKFFFIDECAEITLEANPENAGKSAFSSLREAGINRLSLGVQALDDEALHFLGRSHNARQARQAIDCAQAVFPKMSFDLIAARPGQNEDSWRRELQSALALAPSHLSIYQLSCPEGTRFHRLWRRGQITLPDDDEAARLYELTDDLCRAAALQRYEISSHAKPGHEARHNLAYWHYLDYAGLGPGAHGRLTLDNGDFIASLTPRQPRAWFVSALMSGKKNDVLTHYQCSALSAQARGEEMLMMGLRLTQGLSLKRFRAITGRGLNENNLALLCAAGLVRQTSDHLRCTPKGALVLDSIIDQLIH